MGVACAGNVLGRRAELHRDRDLVNQLSGGRAEDVASQNPVGLPVGQNLDHPVRSERRLRPPVPLEGEPGRLVFRAVRFQLFLGAADPRCFRMGVHDRRNDVVVHMARAARQRFRHRDALVLRLVGEHGPRGRVADDMDPLRGRAPGFVTDHESPRVGFDARIFQTQPLGDRPAARRDQNDVRGLPQLFLAAPFPVGQIQRAAGPLERPDFRA